MKVTLNTKDKKKLKLAKLALEDLFLEVEINTVDKNKEEKPWIKFDNSKKFFLDENIDFIQSIENAYARYLIDTQNLNYREKSLGIVIDKDNNFLLVQLTSYGDNDWNFPGGGIEEGESAEEAMLRELWEELGSKDFKILSKSKNSIKYDWPDYIIVKDIKKRRGKTFRGQNQNIFLVEFTGNINEIKHDPEEIRIVKWVKREDLNSHLNFPSQKELTEKVLQELL